MKKKKGAKPRNKRDIEPYLIASRAHICVFYDCVIRPSALGFTTHAYVGLSNRLDPGTSGASEIQISLYKFLYWWHEQTGESAPNLLIHVFLAPSFSEKELHQTITDQYPDMHLMNATNCNDTSDWPRYLYIIGIGNAINTKSIILKPTSSRTGLHCGYPAKPLTRFLLGFTRHMKEHTLYINHFVQDSIKDLTHIVAVHGSIALKIYNLRREIREHPRDYRHTQQEAENAKHQISLLLQDLERLTLQ